MLVIALVAENRKRDTRPDCYALCWKHYLVFFMLGIVIWQRGHDLMFPEWYLVPGDHIIIARSSNGAVHKKLPTSGRIELDSHTDSIVLGSNCVVLHQTGKVYEVSLYSDDYEAIKNVPVVCGATLCTDTVDNQEYILVFNKSLWMGDSLTHSLINPNQLCAFGTEVQDNPFSKERLSIQPASHDIAIPLQTLSTIIYANTRAPTDQELGQHPHIVLSSTADWDPHHVRFPSHALHCKRD